MMLGHGDFGSCAPRHVWRRAVRKACLAAALVVLASPAGSDVLQADDLSRVAAIQAQFSLVMSDLAQSAQRSDLAAPERDCIGAMFDDLLGITGELSGYQNLLTIETKLNDPSGSDTVRPLMRFASAKALDLLRGEREHVRQTPDSCLRLPIAGSRQRGLLQFLDATITTLEGVNARL